MHELNRISVQSRRSNGVNPQPRRYSHLKCWRGWSRKGSEEPKGLLHTRSTRKLRRMFESVTTNRIHGIHKSVRWTWRKETWTIAPMGKMQACKRPDYVDSKSTIHMQRFRNLQAGWRIPSIFELPSNSKQRMEGDTYRSLSLQIKKSTGGDQDLS